MDFKNVDFIIISSIDWDFLWQRHQSFATGFAVKGARVFFINNTGFRNIELRDIKRVTKRIKDAIRKKNQKTNSIPENVKVFSPIILPPISKFEVFLNKLFFIPKLVKKIELNNLKQNLVIITYLPTATSIDIIKKLKPKLVIYDCVTNFRSIPNLPKNFELIESELLSYVDILLVDSDFLYKTYAKKHRNVYQIHHGVNFNLFYNCFNAKINPQKICYFGGISQHLNFEIIEKLAQKHEVFLYGENLIQYVSASKNIHIERSYPQELLVEKIKDSKCIILPYRFETEFMKGVIPAKIYECLATGKPILSTPLNNYNEEIRNNIYLCKNAQEFLSTLYNIDKLENEEKRRKRIEIARKHSFEKSFQALIKIISKFL